MGIEERKQREREQMQALILAAAKDLFLEKGFEDTSIRAIAERIEYSPATIYLYYKDKDAIFLALHQEGFHRMNREFAPLAFVRDPFERLLAMGRVYVEFAVQNPDFYELMFIKKGPIESLERPEEWKHGEDTFGFLVKVVEECQSQGRFKEKSPIQLAFMIWSCVHGMCALHVCCRVQVIHGVPKESLLPNALQYLNDFLERL